MASATLPSDLAFALAVTVYPLLRRIFTGSKPSLGRLVAVNKATSAVHSSLTTVLAAYFLYRYRIQHQGAPPASGKEGLVARQGPAAGVSRYPDDSRNPAIQIRSTLGNIITAFECGYLLQDTFALVWEARRRSRLAGSKTDLPLLRMILAHADKTLLTHHVGIGIALLILQHYIHGGRERGIHIIVQLVLMNSSTPLLNIRWWLRTYHPNQRMLCLASDLAFATAFYLARIRLVEWVLRDYGTAHGRNSAWKTYWEDLRLPCQLGTGALYVANAGWWTILVSNIMQRLVRDLRWS
ncbi:MAG: hypothetical protein LQ350_007138 [Teloschistes chrysophthalmus]|nr:MAG: hypothetical protein LQ350_007138 [Niorma chrysophthalma]